MAINKYLKEVINNILTKKLIPVNISKSPNALTIDIQTENPTGLISVIYKNEETREQDFKYFDDQVFYKLPFNPNFNNLNLQV